MKKFKQNQLKDAAKLLNQGGVLAFPTETVFGLGVVYDNKDAYSDLVSIKRRPPEKPFTLMCAETKDIEKYAYINESAKKLIDKYIPGQFTIILKAKEDLPSYVRSKEGFVGIRVPDYPLVQNLIKEVGKPLLVPSANRSGEQPAHTSDEVINNFDDEIDGVILGESVSNTPSTVVFGDKNV